MTSCDRCDKNEAEYPIQCHCNVFKLNTYHIIGGGKWREEWCDDCITESFDRCYHKDHRVIEDTGDEHHVTFYQMEDCREGTR